MPRRLARRTRYATRKPIRFGSHIRFRPIARILKSKHLKKTRAQEAEVATDDREGKGGNVARIQRYLAFVPSSNAKELVGARIRSVNDGLPLAESACRKYCLD